MILISILICIVMIMSSCAFYGKNNNETVAESPRITYFMPKKGSLVELNAIQNDLPISKYLNQVTGIEVEYIHPEIGDGFPALNLLIASGNRPDIMEMDWRMYPGGREKAIEDGIVLVLNDYLPEYAPDFYNVIMQDAEVLKTIKSQKGKIYCFPMIVDDDILKTYTGPVLRKDWLDICGLDVPETIADWEIVLTAFKEKLQAEMPFTAPLSIYTETAMFMGAYGVVLDFFVDDGVVKYGPLEDGFYQCLVLLRDWYEKGLLDPDFARRSMDHVLPSLQTSRAGSSVISAGSGMGKVQELAEKSGKTKFQLIAAPYPVLEKGTRPKFGHTTFPVQSIAVSAASENIPTALKFLNYGYTEEGKYTYNFGIPGESYTMVDGKPTYSELILNNPELPMSQAMTKYIRANDFGPFIQTKDYILQYYRTPQLKQALNLWLDTDARKHMIPDMGFATEDLLTMNEELEELTSYVRDKFVRFTMGIDDLSLYPDFKITVESLSGNLIEIYQRSYDNYVDR